MCEIMRDGVNEAVDGSEERRGWRPGRCHEGGNDDGDQRLHVLGDVSGESTGEGRNEF